MVRSHTTERLFQSHMCTKPSLKGGRAPSGAWRTKGATQIRMGLPSVHNCKKSGQVRFLTDFREVNKRIVRTPFPIPKISDVLQELEGFTFATTIDLNMGYWTIRLDPDTQKYALLSSTGGSIHTCDCPWIYQGRLVFSKRRCQT